LEQIRLGFAARYRVEMERLHRQMEVTNRRAEEVNELDRLDEALGRMMDHDNPVCVVIIIIHHHCADCVMLLNFISRFI
jgi:hypothetical protein